MNADRDKRVSKVRRDATRSKVKKKRGDPRAVGEEFVVAERRNKPTISQFRARKEKRERWYLLDPNIGRLLDGDEVRRSWRLAKLQVSDDDVGNLDDSETCARRKRRGRVSERNKGKRPPSKLTSVGETVDGSSIDSEDGLLTTTSEKRISESGTWKDRRIGTGNDGVGSNVDGFSVSRDDARDSNDLLRGSGDGGSEGGEGVD